MSRVLRVDGSKVRTPRSQSTTSRFPRCAMYSAAISHSSMVAVIPRLRSTGLPASPTACSRPKFDMFLVPTCSMSACSATAGTSRASTTSVTNGSPVASRTSMRISRPRIPSPWNAYGEVRGLNAPPRMIAAPAALAISAASRVCWGVSTAQGPPMKVNVSGPMGTDRAPPTQTVLRSGWCCRLTNLNGSEIRCTSATPWIDRRFSPWKESMSPTKPMMVRTTPLLTNASPPTERTFSTTRSTSATVASGLMTTTMVSSSQLGRPTGDDERPSRNGLGRWTVATSGVGRLLP